MVRLLGAGKFDLYIWIDITQLFQNENNFLTDPSHSTEDLMLLLQAEKEFLNEMLSDQPKSKNQTKLNKMVKNYLSHIDYDL